MYMMTFQFAKDSILLPAHLFAFKHFGWTGFKIEVKGDLVRIELFEIDDQGDNAAAYKLGQIVGCAVKDLTALMVKYESPSLSTGYSAEEDD